MKNTINMVKGNDENDKKIILIAHGLGVKLSLLFDSYFPNSIEVIFAFDGLPNMNNIASYQFLQSLIEWLVISLIYILWKPVAEILNRAFVKYYYYPQINNQLLVNLNTDMLAHHFHLSQYYFQQIYSQIFLRKNKAQQIQTNIIYFYSEQDILYQQNNQFIIQLINRKGSELHAIKGGYWAAFQQENIFKILQIIQRRINQID